MVVATARAVRRTDGNQNPDAAHSEELFQLVPAVTMNQKIAVGVVFVSAMFMNIMDITIVNVALPTIGRDFHIAPTAVDGIVIAYLVSLAVFIPASGWLGDRFGGKRVLMTAIVVFTVGSVLCGLAQNMTELVIFPGHPRCRRRHVGPGRDGHAATGSSPLPSGCGPPAS